MRRILQFVHEYVFFLDFYKHKLLKKIIQRKSETYSFNCSCHSFEFN